MLFYRMPRFGDFNFAIHFGKCRCSVQVRRCTWLFSVNLEALPAHTPRDFQKIGFVSFGCQKSRVDQHRVLVHFPIWDRDSHSETAAPPLCLLAILHIGRSRVFRDKLKLKMLIHLFEWFMDRGSRVHLDHTWEYGDKDWVVMCCLWRLSVYENRLDCIQRSMGIKYTVPTTASSPFCSTSQPSSSFLHSIESFAQAASLDLLSLFDFSQIFKLKSSRCVPQFMQVSSSPWRSKFAAMVCLRRYRVPMEWTCLGYLVSDISRLFFLFCYSVF